MNIELRYAYQKALIYASLDDFTPAAALGNIYGGFDGVDSCRWASTSLTFLCRNLITGLICFNKMQSKYALMPQNLLHKRMQLEYLEWRETGIPSTLWNSIYFEGAEKLNDILSRNLLTGWDALEKPLNISFINEIIDLYKGREPEPQELPKIPPC
ncbi:hypothetical protein ABE501_20195 [Comamonas testosteroni]